MQTNIVDVLCILEDQLFLFNYWYHIDHAHSEDVFLSTESLQEIERELYKQLLQLSPEENYLSASLLMRGICNCLALIQRRDGCTSELNTIHDLNNNIENEILRQWTEVNSVEILLKLKKNISFLIQYGRHQVLHSGCFKYDSSCHRCKYKAASDLIQDVNEGNHSGEPCHHYMMPILRDTTHTVNQKLQETSLSQIYTPSLDISIGFEKKKVAVQNSRDVLCQLLKKEHKIQQEINEIRTPYALSLGCYADTSIILLYLLRRMKTVLYFSPAEGSVSPSSYMAGRVTYDSSMSKLKRALSSVVATKQDIRSSLESFDYLIVDPCTCFGQESKFLRYSIIAKHFHLAHDVSPDAIFKSRHAWESMQVKSLFDSDWSTSTDRLAYCVILTSIFNTWLSVQDISCIHQLKWERVECSPTDLIGTNIYALYDNEQIGLRISSDLRLHGTYDSVLAMLLAYLLHLHDSSICYNSYGIQDILFGH